MSEDFLLKWNDHHNLFFVGAEELCESEEYTDVTLAAGSKFFPAHKLVLSICSPYFRQLFKHLGRDKSVVFLKDVDHRHLDLLLQYMYKGEIKVQEDELVAVLNTAQGLEIKGLSENKTNIEGNSPEQKFKPSGIKRPIVTTENKEPVFKKRLNTKSNEFTRENMRTSSPITISPSPSLPLHTEVYQVKEEINSVHIDVDVPDQGGGDVVEVRGLGQELSNCHSVETGFDGGFDGEFDQEVVELENSGQFENGTEGAKICPYCQKEFKKMSSLKQHLPVHTKEKNFECNLCAASYTRSSSLYSHVRQKHQQSMDTQQFQEFLD